MQSFDGRVVLVTGASSGIGRAAAVLLARQGARVIVAARREEAGLETARLAAEVGGSAEFIRTDISDADSIEALFDAIDERYGRLDAAFNNAGMEADARALPDTPIATFDEVFSTNVRGTWLCLRREMAIMRRQRSGTIVNTSSIAGFIAYPEASVYTASKHAVVGMTKSASLDLADIGIRVNCLCPGATRGEMASRWALRVEGGEETMAAAIPVKRLSDPEEQARVALFLLSDAASYINGAVVVADGGLSVN